jgi:hypothetical protein
LPAALGSISVTRSSRSSDASRHSASISPPPEQHRLGDLLVDDLLHRAQHAQVAGLGEHDPPRVARAVLVHRRA